MSKRFPQMFHKMIYTNGQRTHEKVPGFISHQRNGISEVKSTEKPNACEDIKQPKMSNTASGSVKWSTRFEEQFVSSYKIKQHLPRDPPVSLPVFNPQEMKTFIHRNIYPRMFIVALLIMTQKWKQPNCQQQENAKRTVAPSDNGTPLGNWKDLPNVNEFHRLLSKRSQIPKSTFCVIPFIWHLRTSTSITLIETRTGMACGG